LPTLARSRVFTEMLQLARQEIAELFLALLILLMVDENITKKKILYIYYLCCPISCFSLRDIVPLRVVPHHCMASAIFGQKPVDARRKKIRSLSPMDMNVRTVVAALIEGPKSYGGLKSATRLSDRWLSKKLEELSSSGLIEHPVNNYQLKNPTEIINADPVFAQHLKGKISLKGNAKLIAEEISQNEQVVSVILFGSLAKEQSIG